MHAAYVEDAGGECAQGEKEREKLRSRLLWRVVGKRVLLRWVTHAQEAQGVA